MKAWRWAVIAGLAVVLAATPALALKSDRRIVTMTTMELPLVPVEELDYSSVRVELAHGEVALGEPEMRQTESLCVPKNSENKLKDVMKVPTHYYEIPFSARGGVLVVRDGSGGVLFADRLDGVESSVKFGYDQCRYWLPGTLQKDFEDRRASVAGKARDSARSSFKARAERIVDDVLFFRSVDENYPIYTFRDKKREYADLDEAAALAERGYAALQSSSDGQVLREAMDIWEQALAQADLNDKDARINRNVAVRLHVNLGAALLAMEQPADAVRHLETAARFGGTTSNSKGVGSGDLLDRARRRDARSGRNSGLDDASPTEIDSLVARSDAYRGTIPIDLRPSSELARMESVHAAFVGELAVELARAEQDRQEAAAAAGDENPYERMVTRTSMQGFILFLMPFPKKLGDFPAEVCELTYLNQLRVSGHGYDSVPEQIGKLTELKVLDLSGNNLETIPASIRFLDKLSKLDLSKNEIARLPEEIGELKSLKTLNLKGNPLAPGEAERLQQLLPNTKIKL